MSTHHFSFLISCICNWTFPIFSLSVVFYWFVSASLKRNLVFSSSSWEGFVQKVHHSCPPSQRLCTSVFQSVFLLVVEHLFQSVVAFVFVFLTLLYGGYVFKDAWQLSSLQSGDEQSFTFELLTFQLFSLKTFHSCQCKTFLKQPLLKCHCTPLDAFRPPKLCLYLQKIPRLKLESAPLRILCRICQLKKVFDLGERVLRRHFCGARKKFKSCWSSEHTLSWWSSRSSLSYSWSQSSWLSFTMIITVMTIQVTWDCQECSGVSHSRGNKVLRFQFVTQQPSQNYSSPSKWSCYIL